MTATRLGGLWSSIENEGGLKPEALRFLDTGVTFPTGIVLAGVDGSGHRHLCIPAPTTELGREDRRSQGVTIEVRNLINAKKQQQLFVDVRCHRPDLNPIFEVVADDILAQAQRKPESPFSAAHTILERWRELLEPSSEPQLGPSQLAALLAELLLLEQLGNGTPPLNYWMGPDKGTHDFVCGAADFEVKSTLSTAGRDVEVHGLSQLTASKKAKLYLWWIRLRASPGRGTSVPATVERLLQRDVDKVALLKKLKLMGYVTKDEKRYESSTFETVESSLYEVNNDFPRLTKDSFKGGLPDEIKNVNYTLSLGLRKPVALSSSAAKVVLSSVR